MRRPTAAVGLALALAYVVVAVAHARLGGGSRPLFDGFAPPPPYNWVHPPKEFAAGNTVPKPSSFEIALGPAGSAVSGGSSSDGQMIFSIPAGAIAAHAPDTNVKVDVTPLDPAGLAPPLPGLNADGNAYRVDFTYQPSGAPVPALAVPSDIFLVVPSPAQTVLFSADGKTWEMLPFRPAADPTQVGGAINRPGYFEAAAPPAPAPTGTGDTHDRAGQLVAVAAVTIGLGLLLGLGPVGWRRLRGRGAA